VSPVAQLKQGSPAAFDAVYEAWRPRLFTFLLRLCDDRGVAEDLLQETFLRLARDRATLRDDTEPGAWLFTVARNLATSHQRWRRLRLAVGRALGEPPTQVEPAFEQVAARGDVRRVERALQALPVDLREVVLLVSVEGLDATVVAGIVGATPEAVRKRLSRARAQLRLAVDEPEAPILSAGVTHEPA
jgi:RNA polymerase sigma-70 factor (ECF subfamily)